MASGQPLSGAAMMEAVRGKAVEDLPIIDWKEAVGVIGGDAEADLIIVEFVALFYHEGLSRLKKILGAALMYRQGIKQHQFPGDRMRTVEVIVKDEAHGLKGSAANLRLWKIAKVAESIELPLKELVSAPEGFGRGTHEQIKQVMDSFCVFPCKEIKQLMDEYRRLAGFIQRDMRAQVTTTDNVEEELPADVLTSWKKISEGHFDVNIVLPYKEFWDGSKQLPTKQTGDSLTAGSPLASSAAAVPAEQSSGSQPSSEAPAAAMASSVSATTPPDTAAQMPPPCAPGTAASTAETDVSSKPPSAISAGPVSPVASGTNRAAASPSPFATDKRQTTISFGTLMASPSISGTRYSAPAPVPVSATVPDGVPALGAPGARKPDSAPPPVVPDGVASKYAVAAVPVGNAAPSPPKSSDKPAPAVLPVKDLAAPAPGPEAAEHGKS